MCSVPLVIYSLTLITIVTFLHVRGTLRFLYLASKLQGPTLWEIVTVHARQLWGENPLNPIWKITNHYSYRPWSLWTATGDLLVYVSDPQTVSEVYKCKNLCDKPDLLYREMGRYLGKGTLVLSGQEWRSHRKAVNPSFRKGILESHMDILNDGAEHIIAKLHRRGDGEIIEIRDFTDDELANTAIRFATSNRISFPNIQRYCISLARGLYIIQQKTLNPIRFWFFSTFTKTIQEHEEYIRSTRNELKIASIQLKDSVLAQMNERTDTEPRDALECGLYMLTKMGKNFDDDEIFDECLTIVAAAAETTKTAVKATLLLLALHQDVQQRVFEELENIFGSSDQSPIPRDLDKMEYLEMVVKETLRLFPSVPVFMREAAEETNLNGTIIPKGCCVVINIFSMHRNPTVFKDPLAFIPERFLPDACKNRHPYSYLPFSSGNRNCVGQAQAMMTIKIVVSSIVRQFRIFPVEGFKEVIDIKLKMNVTMDLKESLVILKDRNIRPT